MQMFEHAHIGALTLKNRIIRSATFEGRCDNHGVPTEEYLRWYEVLARQEIGAIMCDSGEPTRCHRD